MDNKFFNQTVINRIFAVDFAQPQKVGFFHRIWRKLCALKTA